MRKCISVIIAFLASSFCCSLFAQISVYYSEKENQIGWAIGPTNKNFERNNEAKQHCISRGGTDPYLQFSSSEGYGCYAIVMGNKKNGSRGYGMAGGFKTEDEALKNAKNYAMFLNEVEGSDFTVLAKGCLEAPKQPVTQEQQPEWSEWKTMPCIRGIKYRVKQMKVFDLNEQYHYYFEASNDYSETAFFDFNLLDEKGDIRFGNRHEIRPGATIAFNHKMTSNYITSFRIDNLCLISDNKDYLNCEEAQAGHKLNGKSENKPAEETKPQSEVTRVPAAMPNWSEWKTDECFKGLRYRMKHFPVYDLTKQYHYYFEFISNYKEVVYFDFDLLDESGNIRFGNRRSIRPGDKIEFNHKMTSNYIASTKIEKVSLKTDDKEYLSCEGTVVASNTDWQKDAMTAVLLACEEKAIRSKLNYPAKEQELKSVIEKENAFEKRFKEKYGKRTDLTDKQVNDFLAQEMEKACGSGNNSSSIENTTMEQDVKVFLDQACEFVAKMERLQNNKSLPASEAKRQETIINDAFGLSMIKYQKKYCPEGKTDMTLCNQFGNLLEVEGKKRNCGLEKIH